MYCQCYMCGGSTTDDILSITQYGLLPICSDKCLKEVNASVEMPPRIKAIYDQQQEENKKIKCDECPNDVKFSEKCVDCDHGITSLSKQAT